MIDGPFTEQVMAAIPPLNDLATEMLLEARSIDPPPRMVEDVNGNEIDIPSIESYRLIVGDQVSGPLSGPIRGCSMRRRFSRPPYSAPGEADAYLSTKGRGARATAAGPGGPAGGVCADDAGGARVPTLTSDAASGCVEKANGPEGFPRGAALNLASPCLALPGPASPSLAGPCPATPRSRTHPRPAFPGKLLPDCHSDHQASGQLIDLTRPSHGTRAPQNLSL